MNESFKQEVKNRWGNTKAYTEYLDKTKKYSTETFDSLSKGLDKIFYEFSVCMNDNTPDSADSLFLVKKLKDYITVNFYECTNDLLYDLGQMYVQDERFENNIDKHKKGTALFIKDAITIFCKK